MRPSRPGQWSEEPERSERKEVAEQVARRRPLEAKPEALRDRGEGSEGRPRRRPAADGATHSELHALVRRKRQREEDQGREQHRPGDGEGDQPYPCPGGTPAPHPPGRRSGTPAAPRPGRSRRAGIARRRTRVPSSPDLVPMSARLHGRVELAQRIGVNRQTIGYLERGESNPSLVLAFRLADLFKVSIEEIFVHG